MLDTNEPLGVSWHDSALTITKGQQKDLKDFMLADIQWTERQLAYISSQMGGWIATATVVRETEKKSLRARLRDKAARGAMPCPANVNLPGSVIVPQRPRSDAGTDLQLTELFRGKRFRAKRTELRENVREILRSLDEATGGHVAERIDEKTSPYREEALAIVLAMTPDIVEEFMANAAPILGIITDIAGVGLSLWDAAVKEAGRRRVHRAVHRLDNTNAKTVGAALRAYARDMRNQKLRDAAVDGGAALVKTLGLTLDFGLISGPVLAACQAIYRLAAAVENVITLLQERDEMNRLIQRGVCLSNLGSYPLLASYAVAYMDDSWLMGLGGHPGERKGPKEILALLGSVSVLRALATEVINESAFELSL